MKIYHEQLMQLKNRIENLRGEVDRLSLELFDIDKKVLVIINAMEKDIKGRKYFDDKTGQWVDEKSDALGPSGEIEPDFY